METDPFIVIFFKIICPTSLPNKSSEEVCFYKTFKITIGKIIVYFLL